jgi:ornithine cyclodeaminase
MVIFFLSAGFHATTGVLTGFTLALLYMMTPLQVIMKLQVIMNSLPGLAARMLGSGMCSIAQKLAAIQHSQHGGTIEVVTLMENGNTGESNILALGAADVLSLLEGQELAIVDVVRDAYRLHGQGNSSLPHSTFLRFPHRPADRIIALPAHLGGNIDTAGVKWISSFPGNIERGIERASAILILNSMSTGHPRVVMEGSIISAKRTAASAALAAQALQSGQVETAGFIGCGPINFEIARFLLATCPCIRTFLVFDLHQQRALSFQAQCRNAFPEVETKVADKLTKVLAGAPLISFATTAAKPHVESLDVCAPGTVILHVSLRDLSSAVILGNDNVVDDVDHVCRAQTSIHLAEQKTGNRAFVRCSLPDILNGAAKPRASDSGVTIFSPFGLGLLDVALGVFTWAAAVNCQKGIVIPGFLAQHCESNPSLRRRKSRLKRQAPPAERLCF